MPSACCSRARPSPTARGCTGSSTWSASSAWWRAFFLRSNNTLYLVLLATAAIALFLGIYQLMRSWLWSANTEIIVTSRRVIYKTGFISRNTVEMNLDKVESVLVQQTLVGRMLDYGAVVIRGVGAGLEPIRNIGAPLMLHRHISAQA
jgi:uncharacterized membrane protein YdbT with pleckstrin-like domain